MSINFKIFTLFPEVFDSYLKSSILGRALNKNIWNYQLINIRDYSKDRFKHVDDVPYSGGSGMVIKPDIIADAIDKNCDVPKTHFFYMSPRGEVFNQKLVNEVLKYNEIAIICGRYEGIDQRVIDEYNMKEISIGDYVLTGGELPAMVVIDTCVRCIKNVLGNSNSLDTESFGGINNTNYDNLLEYPLYTRPSIWRNRKVPDVLLSGHHSNIEKWKISESERITKERRTDLWNKYIEDKKNTI